MLNVSNNNLQTEKSVKIAEDTQQVQLGAYQDVTEVSATSTNNSIYQTPYQSTNMETFDLGATLSREFQLGTVNWSTTTDTGAIIAEYDFPDDLFVQKFISDKIKDFKLFKAGLRLTFRVSASSWLYGKVLVYANPCYFGDVADMRHVETTTVSVGTASGFPHILVSATASETAILDLPFVSPKRAIEVVGFSPAELWKVRVVVLNPLTHIEGLAADAKILVTAQFVEPQLFLPLVLPESNLRKEVKQKNLKHSIMSDLEGGDTLKSKVLSHPFTKTMEDLYTMGKIATTVMAMTGLSKPSTLDMTQVVKVNPFNDLGTSKGVDSSVVYGLEQENEISTEPNVGGVNVDEMDMQYVLGTPMLVSVVPFVSGSSVAKLSSLTAFSDSGAYCYADFVAQLFRFCSGSYKFKIYITASNAHSVRLVFYLNGNTTQADGDWENCYHKVVDIQGDTEVEMTIPYCYSNMVMDNLNILDTFCLYVKELTWSQASDTVSNPIYLNVYKAAAEDFQVGGLRDYMIQPESNPRKDFSKPFEPLHPSLKAFVHDKLLFGEKYTSLREVIHRYVPVGASIANQTSPFPNYATAGATAPNQFNGTEGIGCIYRFYRGSTRWKLMQKDNTPRTGVFQHGTGPLLYAGLTLSSTVNPVVESSFPWYNRLLFRSTSLPEADRGMLPDLRGGQYAFKAAGDDFSFMFLSPPPDGFLIKNGSNGSLRTFRNWLGT